MIRTVLSVTTLKVEPGNAFASAATDAAGMTAAGQ